MSEYFGNLYYIIFKDEVNEEINKSGYIYYQSIQGCKQGNTLYGWPLYYIILYVQMDLV